MQKHFASLSASIDPVSLMSRIAVQTCLFTPKAEGTAVSIYTSNDEFVVVSAHGLTASLLGLTLPGQGTFQGRAIATGQPQISHNTPVDPEITDQVRFIGNSLGIRSLAVIPLLHNNIPIGTLSLTATNSHWFTDADIASMVSLSGFMSALIDSHSELSRLLDELLGDPDAAGTRSTARFVASVLTPQAAEREHLHDQLDALLASPSDLIPAFQPIVDLATGRVLGYEGLSRFPRHPETTPVQWFETARLLGRGGSLEVMALRRILATSECLPSHCFVSVNLGPSTVLDPEVHDLLAAYNRPLVIEITEHERFPQDLADNLKPLRDTGIRLAIDDTGAGFASFTQLLRLRPDFIKIDGELTAGIENDPARRALATAIVQLSTEMGAWTVAESIETVAQMRALQRLGISLGQGFATGPPR